VSSLRLVQMGLFRQLSLPRFLQKWLASQGRDDEAIDTIAFVANFNGKPMPKITAVDLKNVC
jgi:hypothetical protein